MDWRSYLLRWISVTSKRKVKSLTRYDARRFIAFSPCRAETRHVFDDSSILDLHSCVRFLVFRSLFKSIVALIFARTSYSLLTNKYQPNRWLPSSSKEYGAKCDCRFNWRQIQRCLSSFKLPSRGKKMSARMEEKDAKLTAKLPLVASG